jgi:hypothetical protein
LGNQPIIEPQPIGTIVDLSLGKTNGIGNGISFQIAPVIGGNLQQSL